MVGMWKWVPWSGLRGAVDAKQKVSQAAKLFMSATVLRRYPLGIPKRTPKTGNGKKCVVAATL